MDVINGLRVLVGTAQVSEGRFCSATQGIFRGGGWVRGSGRAGPGEWARRRPERRRPGRLKCRVVFGQEGNGRRGLRAGWYLDAQGLAAQLFGHTRNDRQ